MFAKLSDMSYTALTHVMQGHPNHRIFPACLPLLRELPEVPPVIIEALLMYAHGDRSRRPHLHIQRVVGRDLPSDVVKLRVPPEEEWRSEFAPEPEMNWEELAPGSDLYGPGTTYIHDGTYVCDMWIGMPQYCPTDMAEYEFPKGMNMQDVKRVAIVPESGGAYLHWEEIVRLCPNVTTVVMGTYRLYCRIIAPIPTPYLGKRLRFLTLSGTDEADLNKVVELCASFTEWVCMPSNSRIGKLPMEAISRALDNPDNALQGVAMWDEYGEASKPILPPSTDNVLWTKLSERTVVYNTGCWIIAARRTAYPLWAPRDKHLMYAAEMMWTAIKNPEIVLAPKDPHPTTSRKCLQVEMTFSPS